jgi:hypothetical protein
MPSPEPPPPPAPAPPPVAAAPPQLATPALSPPPPPTPERVEIRWPERLSAVCSLFSAVAAVIALFLVVPQLRSANEAINANTLEQIYSRMHDINKTFVEHPELKPYFYDGMRLEDPNPLAEAKHLDMVQVRSQVPAMAELMCDFFAQALIELKRLPPQAYDGWKNYIRDMYLKSPELRRYYNANKQWYQYADAADLFEDAEALLQASAAKAAKPVPTPPPPVVTPAPRPSNAIPAR